MCFRRSTPGIRWRTRNGQWAYGGAGAGEGGGIRAHSLLRIHDVSIRDTHSKQVTFTFTDSQYHAVSQSHTQFTLVSQLKPLLDSFGTRLADGCRDEDGDGDEKLISSRLCRTARARSIHLARAAQTTHAAKPRPT